MPVAVDPEFHIMLLPQRNYWSYVRAARDFSVKFDVALTFRPENAVGYHQPDQAITVVNVPGEFPAQGDIVAWLKARAPQVYLDVIDVTSADQLKAVLANRITLGLPLGQRIIEPEPEPQPFRLRWPVDSQVITQRFGVNPDLYRRFGLPAHEGVDFRAPMNANVYACADGEVYRVSDGRDGNAYGIHVRIQHEGGYRTIYAHLNAARVTVGQKVKTGELIGLADSTGNSTGSHLHLTLKKDGATAARQTNYPSDIIDPTPFLYFPTEEERPEPAFPRSLWPPQVALVGLHGRADGRMQEPDWGVVLSARVEALKLTSAAGPEDVERALRINRQMFIAVRLFADFRNRVVPARDFARWVETDMAQFYSRGVRYFEVHNEPNLTPEGYGRSWKTGQEFGQWFLEVKGILAAKFSGAKFGWPGLSPGPSVSGIRFDEDQFLDSAGSSIDQADWIGCHCYWRDEVEMFSTIGGLNYRKYRERWPNKLLLITEFSNPSPNVDLKSKGEQYVKYYQHLRQVPGVGAAFSFVVSASADFPHEIWRREDGLQTPIPGIVAKRTL